MIWELCPHCAEEVEIMEALHKQNCPKCNKPIKPCSLCVMKEAECNKCLW